jgi:dihydrofolate reductase
MGQRVNRLTSIVATNEYGAIGVRNRLPWKLRTDLKFFKETTKNHVVIMGRRTFDSLEGKPLAGRTNIVLSHFNLFPQSDLLRSAISIGEALSLAERYSKANADVFVIGGSMTYSQFADYVDRYLITVVDKDVPDADTFLDPDIFGAVSDWNHQVLDRFEPHAGDECGFRIVEMTRRDEAAQASLRSVVIANHNTAAGGASRRLGRVNSRAYA